MYALEMEAFTHLRHAARTLIEELLNLLEVLNSAIDELAWPSYEIIHSRPLLLHQAAQDGRVCDMKKYLKASPTSAMELTASRETALHCAVSGGQVEAARFMLEWLKGKSFCRYVINMKDCAGNTALHLAAAKKQFQIVKQLLDYGNLLEINAKNYAGFTALDSLNEDLDMDKEIGKILKEAGALRGRDLVDQKVNESNHEVLIDVGKEWQQRSSDYVVMPRYLLNRLYVKLVLATLLAYFAFYLELTLPPRIEAQVYESSSSSSSGETDTFSGGKQETVIKQMFLHMFVFTNSIMFFTSLAIITILTHELPLKPWLPITVLSAFGAFMCLVTANSPQDFVTVLSIGSFILLAAFLKCLALDKVVNHLLEWAWIRVKM